MLIGKYLYVIDYCKLKNTQLLMSFNISQTLTTLFILYYIK